MGSSGWMYWITARATDSVLGGPCQSGDKVPTFLGVLRYDMFNICLRAIDQGFFDYFFRGKN